MFMVSDTVSQSEGHTHDIPCQLTDVFNNDTKINPNLAKAINEVCGKKLQYTSKNKNKAE